MKAVPYDRLLLLSINEVEIPVAKLFLLHEAFALIKIHLGILAETRNGVSAGRGT